MPDKDDCKEATVNQVGRRAFCGQMAGGLGAIALASLLEQDGCLAAPADQPSSGVATGRVGVDPKRAMNPKRLRKASGS